MKCAFRSLAAATTAAALLSPFAVGAQEVTGQIRPRFEFRDPAPGGGLDDFVSMRTRLGVRVPVDELVSVFVQFQDVRIFGEETHPLFDYRGDAIDLHEAYLTVRGDAFSWLTTRVGRMETTFGGERLVGPVGWTQQGQSFDGLRLDVETGAATWALVGYAINDETAPTTNEDEDLVGFYGSIPEVGPGDLDLYWLYNRINAALETDEHLVGARYVYSGAVDARVEGTLGTGTRAGADVSSYMFGGRVGRAFADGDFTATLWYDYLSGDDPDTPEVEVFNTFFGTNHKFYGLADLFLDIPAHTGGAGLQDMALKLLWRARSDVTARVDVHSFRAAEQGSLSGAHFGDELDLSLSHRYSSNLTATVGFSYILQDDPFEEVGRLDDDLTWFYVMLDATF